MESVGPSQGLSSLCTAVVFCGGRATRLRDQLRGAPKALLLLDTRPYLHSLLLCIRDAGLKDVVLCVSPFTQNIIDVIRGGNEYGLKVRYSLDSGTRENADALWQARTQIHTPLAVCINGDTIFNIDFAKLIQTHVRSGATATLVASEREDQPHPHGLEVSSDGKVVDLHEWAQDAGFPILRSPSSRSFSNSGVYVFDMARLEKDWPEADRAGKIEQGLLRGLAAKRDLIAMKNGDRYLLDIGTPERLLTARSQIDSISQVFAL